MKKKDIRTAVTRRDVITARAPASVAETAANRIMASAQTAHDHANGEERELSLISTSKGLGHLFVKARQFSKSKTMHSP
jgi:hypothetical protein